MQANSPIQQIVSFFFATDTKVRMDLGPPNSAS